MKNYDSEQMLKTAVIGTGYLGKFHAQKYALIEDCDLIAIVDQNPQTCAEIAKANSTEAVSDYRELAGAVDAVSIATPTQSHFEVARDFLLAGTHVLIEKPMTVTVEQAQTLIDIASENQLVLQVGHLERFNPALRAVDSYLTQPLFIESHRLAPFTPRGADVNVVLDLMIHDIDIILNMVGSDVESIDASGAVVISNEIDIANARLRFKNGCVANVTASRVSDKMERRMRFFQNSSYVAVDFQGNKAKVCQPTKTLNENGMPDIVCEDFVLEKGDAILAEIRSFCESIRTGSEPLVSGNDGKRALETAIDISSQLAK